MKRRLFSVLGCLLIFFSSSLLAFAASARVIDEAGLLAQPEEILLENKIQTITDQFQIDAVILLVQSLSGKSSTSYADDYFDANGFGIGESHSGVLLLLSMEDRDWAISTCGEAIYALPNNKIEALFSKISSALSANQFYSALDQYLDGLASCFEAYRSYENADSLINVAKLNAKSILIAFVVGLIGAGIILLIMVQSMNTARRQSGAASYVRNGTFHLKKHHDLYLYSTVKKTYRSDNNGSSTHRSASGRSHGGRSGKF